MLVADIFRVGIMGIVGIFKSYQRLLLTNRCVWRKVAALLWLFWSVQLVTAQEAISSEDESISTESAGYRLDAGDTINIRVLGEESLSLELEIGESGSITYPLLREVGARGLTTNELEDKMTSRLIDEEYLIDPDISINIVEYRPFYISGEVEDPGSYPFEPGLTLRRAVSLAGGFTERASRTRITILDGDNDEVEAEEDSELLDMRVNPGYTITVNQRFF